jgi:hypothetical protein
VPDAPTIGFHENAQNAQNARRARISFIAFQLRLGRFAGRFGQ